jgi:hypothetical protein
VARNIGWTKKFAVAAAKEANRDVKGLEAYAQKEEHFHTSGIASDMTYQWIVVLQKKSATKGL